MNTEEFNKKYHVRFPNTCKDCKWFRCQTVTPVCLNPKGFDEPLDFHVTWPYAICDLFEKKEEQNDYRKTER
jgi:hypothetical protein